MTQGHTLQTDLHNLKHWILQHIYTLILTGYGITLTLYILLKEVIG